MKASIFFYDVFISHEQHIQYLAQTYNYMQLDIDRYIIKIESEIDRQLVRLLDIQYLTQTYNCMQLDIDRYIIKIDSEMDRQLVRL